MLILTGIIYFFVDAFLDDYQYRKPYWVLAIGGAITGAILWRSTRSAWDWQKLKKYGLYLASVFAIVVISYYAYGRFGIWYADYKKTQAENREFAARTCNAKEISRIEPTLRRAISSVNERTTVNQMRSIFASLEGSTVRDVTSKLNIKEVVIEASIKPACDSLFRYRIEASFEQDGTPKTYTTYAVNPPQGYNDSKFSWENAPLKDDVEISIPIRTFSYDFADQRQRMIKADEALRQRKAEVELEAFERASDPCIPGISRKERMERLAKSGPVREIALDEYTAGKHKILFGGSYNPNEVLFCD